MIATREIFAPDEYFRDGIFALVSQVVEKAPEVQQVLQPGRFAERWILLAQIAEPAEDRPAGWFSPARAGLVFLALSAPLWCEFFFTADWQHLTAGGHFRF